MNLASMRDIDATDPIGGLGPRVTPAPTPAPQPVRRDDGIVIGPDGKWSTDLPDPTQEVTLKTEPAPDAPIAPKCPPVGSFIRLLRPKCWRINEQAGAICKVLRHYQDEGMDIEGPTGLGWGIHATDESDAERGPCWEPVAPPAVREPLKVGDRVRILCGGCGVPDSEVGQIRTVDRLDGGSTLFRAGSWWHHIEKCGKQWERA